MILSVRFRAPAAASLAVALWLAVPAQAAVEQPDAQSSIGVAPFAPVTLAGKERTVRDTVPDVAGLLAGELSRRSVSRVVSPARMKLGDVTAAAGSTRAGSAVASRTIASSTVASSTIPGSSAGNVRRLADLNGVDSVIVGRSARAKGGGLNVDVELRSGHSGAPEAEYRLEPASDPELPGAVEKLATLILADLAKAEPAPMLPAVSAPRSGETAESTASTDGEEGSVSLMPGGKSDDPISINSEELEVVPLDGGRRLVFSNNVVVVQGDIRLTADRLEAIYPEGASRPDRLVADGHVAVAQGERNASCQQATYERKLQTIVCRGKAEVIQGCDRVRGREIEFDLERERVRVTGAASVLIRPDGEDGGCETKAAVPKDKRKKGKGKAKPKGLLN